MHFTLAGLLLLSFTFVTEISTSKRPKKIKCQEIVDAVNKNENSLWTADTYGYTEIDVDEFVKTKLGAKIKHKKKLTSEEISKIKKTPSQQDELPENFTWANAPLNKTHGCPFNVIRDQSNCGSCWAVSTASAFSDRYCLMTNGTFKTPLSAEHLAACNKFNYGCNGGIMERAYNYLRYNGTVTGGDYESDEGCQTYSIAPCGYPSQMPCAYSMAFTPKCREKKCNNEWYKHKEEKTTYKISYARSLYARWDDYEARREIYYNGPLVATFIIYPDFITYKGGIYKHETPGWYLGGHAIRIVGWGSQNGTKYWHVANSWSTDWGENGYFRILRGYNTAGIESDMTALYPIVAN